MHSITRLKIIVGLSDIELHFTYICIYNKTQLIKPVEYGHKYVLFKTCAMLGKHMYNAGILVHFLATQLCHASPPHAIDTMKYKTTITTTAMTTYNLIFFQNIDLARFLLVVLKVTD